MSNSLRIMSYNCYGLYSSLADLYALCEQLNIILTQETLLFRYELPLLCNIHPDFEEMGISAIDDTDSNLAGRPYGGVAILLENVLALFVNFNFMVILA